MRKRLCGFILFKLMGWTARFTVPIPDKCVVCVAPHTSNWDFFISEMLLGAWNLRAGFLMKKEWFFFPMGVLLRALGGVAVSRGRKTSLVEQMTNRFNQSQLLRIAIAPEATRKANPEWKRGFYYIALGAQVPILLVGYDYKRRLIECTRSFTPTGCYEQDIAEIKSYYKAYQGKYPDNFAV